MNAGRSLTQERGPRDPDRELKSLSDSELRARLIKQRKQTVEGKLSRPLRRMMLLEIIDLENELRRREGKLRPGSDALAARF